MHPYREPHELPSSADASEDRDVALVGVVVWTASVARVTLAFARHEASRELVLALLLVVTLPLIAFPARAR
jgi:hypothetical protein